MGTNFTTVVNGEMSDASQVNQFITPINNLENGSTWCAGWSSGTSSAYTASIFIPLTLVPAGMLVSWIPHVINPGSATFDLNGSGAQPIYYGGRPLIGGELVPGQIILMVSSSGSWTVCSGQSQSITVSAVPDLPASKITSGVFPAARLGTSVPISSGSYLDGYTGAWTPLPSAPVSFPLRAPGGMSSAPTYSFAVDTDTGMCCYGGLLHFSVASYTSLWLSSTGPFSLLPVYSSPTATCYNNASTGEFSITSSSAAHKRDIRTMEAHSDKVGKLRPVRFSGTCSTETDPSGWTESLGLIAEEVAAVIPELTGTITRPKQDPVLMVHYDRLAVFILQAWQESEQRARALEQRVAALEKHLRA